MYKSIYGYAGYVMGYHFWERVGQHVGPWACMCPFTCMHHMFHNNILAQVEPLTSFDFFESSSILPWLRRPISCEVPTDIGSRRCSDWAGITLLIWGRRWYHTPPVLYIGIGGEWCPLCLRLQPELHRLPPRDLYTRREYIGEYACPTRTRARPTRLRRM